jgi:hypothetical protein
MKMISEDVYIVTVGGIEWNWNIANSGISYCQTSAWLSNLMLSPHAHRAPIQRTLVVPSSPPLLSFSVHAPSSFDYSPWLPSLV